MEARFAYDEVPYDTEANPEAHPRSMATLARLFGIVAAAPGTARVLEIGCGDGEHMIAAASYLPRARFVGFDLSAEAVARGSAAAHAGGATNVVLLQRDVCTVRDRGLSGEERAPFDYVIAHGVYSWVPEAVRADVLATMRRALGPAGIGFLSVNASPGWELRRALRILMREVAAEHDEPAARVGAALSLVDELAAARSDAAGFASVLAQAAREYRAHVEHATPPGAPFSRYVFHDLLAECNDPFSVAELRERLGAAGLRLMCETPLRADRARGPFELDEVMARSGSPFLQVLVCRDDATPRAAPALEAVRDLHLWADLAPGPGGTYRTTTGALLRATGESGLARAARAAPGFVDVASLEDDADALARLAQDLFTASCEGVLTLVSEPPAVQGASAMPRLSTHTRMRAQQAVERGATAAVLTSALHRSYRVPLAELRVVQSLDGHTDAETIAARTGTSRAQVEQVIDRFVRHGFAIEAAAER